MSLTPSDFQPQPSTSTSQLLIQFGSLDLRKPINIELISPTNDKTKITVDEDACVLDVLKMVAPEDPENYCLEAFGLVFALQDTISAILQKMKTKTLLLSTAERPYPIRRDRRFAEQEERIERRANQLLHKHWGSFNHSTANMFAYARNLQSEPQTSERSTSDAVNPTMILPLAHPSSSTHNTPLSYAQAAGTKKSGARQSTLAQIKHSISSSPHTMDRIKENLTAVELSPGSYANKLSGLGSFDITDGDCSVSHLRMKLLLELDEVTKEIK